MMKRALSFLSAVALIGWSAGADARRLPTRAELERAVDAFFACTADMDCAGLRPFHRRLTSSRCYPDEGGQPRRIVCIFSGYNIGGNRRRPERFRNDCAYLEPARRGWVMIGSPDADLCPD